MRFTTSRIATLIKELDELDNSIKYEQMIYGSLKNEALEKDEKLSEKMYQDRLDKYMEVRSAIDIVIEYLDGCEVHL